MSVMERKDVLTTGQVARICHVAPRTVSKWFDTGKLRGYRIPGSRDRRIPRRQLEAFMRAHGIPLDGLDGGTCRVLILNAQIDAALLEALRQAGGYEPLAASNGFEAGVAAERFRPHVIVLDVGRDVQEAVALCRNIKEIADLQSARVVATISAQCPEQGPALMGQGFDGCLARPYTLAQLIEAIEKATNLMD